MKKHTVMKTTLNNDTNNETQSQRKKWQNSRFLEPGTRVIHPALKQDFPKGHGDNIVFGNQPALERNPETKVHLEDIWQEDSINNCKTIKMDCKKAYLSKSKLFQPSINVDLKSTLHKQHAVNHGRHTKNRILIGARTTKTNTTKTVVAPTTNVQKLLQPPQQEEDNNNIEHKNKNENKQKSTMIHEQYLKSHGSYQPGEQKRRNYNWKIINVDPITTTFGMLNNTVDRGNSSKGVSEALIQRKQQYQQHSNINANDKDDNKFNNNTTSYTNNMLKSKSRIEDNNKVVVLVHGIKTNKNDNTITTKDCLSIYHNNINNDINDKSNDDLGRSLRPGFRNVITEHAFGCPSIRTDIPKYFPNSIANTQNFGDDVNASYLLRPPLP